MVRIQKSARSLELSAPGYNLTFNADRPWVVSLAAGTGRAVFDLFLGSSVDTVAGRDELAPAGTPELTREGPDTLVATYTSRSSRWNVKRYIFTCTESEVEYRVEVEGRGRITACRYFQGFLDRDVAQLGLGASYFRSGYERPFRDLARGSRPLVDNLLTARPTAAERDMLALWEDSEIDLVDDPTRHGGLDSFLPAPFMFAFDLGAGQPWAVAALAPARDELGFTSFAWRGGQTFGFELCYPGLTVDRTWRSPSMLFNIGGRDEYAGFRAVAEALRQRGRLDDERPPQPEWWRAPIFDGTGEQHSLRGSGSFEEECTQANYHESLAILKNHGLDPGVVWIGAGWLAEDQPGQPEPTRWPGFRDYVDGQHHNGRKVVVAWPLRLKPPVHLTPDPKSLNYRRWLDELVGELCSPTGLDVDGLRIVDHSWPDAQWAHDVLDIVRRAAHAVKPDALIVAPMVNPAFAHLIDMVPLGSLWSDRRSVTQALRHRASLARMASEGWLLAVSDRHAPGHEAWREVIELQPSLGVPVLSYTRHLDQTGEGLDPDDFALVRRVWQDARA